VPVSSGVLAAGSLAVSGLPDPVSALGPWLGAVSGPVLATGHGGDDVSLAVWPLALALAAVHVFAPGRAVLDSIPHRTLVSFGSGVSVAYVFVHLLPEVSAVGEVTVGGDPSLLLGGDVPVLPVEFSVYLLVFAGFVAFYGLDYALRESASPSDEAAGGPPTTRDRDPDHADPGGVFWLHLGSFALYNAVLGYVLVELGGDELSGLLLFALAVGLHLFVNDHGLRGHYEQRYHRYGRWLLAATVFLGVVFAGTSPVQVAHIEMLRAFVAGAIVFNVIKEELPTHRESSFPMFLAGGGLYAALLLVA